MRGFTFLVVLLLPYPLLAHGIGQRIDLPIPLETYLGAAAVVLLLSFLGIGFLGRKQREYSSYLSYDLLRIPQARLLVHPTTVGVLKFVSVATFLMLLYAGFFGSSNVNSNILPAFTWVWFTVGFTYFAAFFGNLWSVVNPWKVIHEVCVKSDESGRIHTWPARIGVWPAFALFFGFRYLENIFPQATEPQTLAAMILTYAVIMFVGMTLFGRSRWLHHADAFTVFFSFLSYFSIFSFHEHKGKKELQLRFPGVGLLQSGLPTVSESAFMMLMLSTVSFDGLSSTALSVFFLQFLRDAGFSLVFAKTALLLLVFLFFSAVYILFIVLIKNYADSNESLLHIARQFIFSLLPIAIAYEVAHFLILLLTEGQRVFTLISDPFGYGWNLFGTAHASINYSIINFKFIWNLEVALILAAHILSLYIAHVVAIRFFQNYRVAVRSQIPMLVLMIGYTVFGLWLLAQPPVLIG